MAQSQRGGSRDNVDSLPDFQVNIGTKDLDRLLRGKSTGSASVMNTLLKSWEQGRGYSFRKIGVFVRRYSKSTRPWMPFHIDGNTYTANIALSTPFAHKGGQLVCLVGGRVQAFDRELGSAIIHGGGVCHAVTPVTEGTRYSLLLFFHAEMGMSKQSPPLAPPEQHKLTGGKLQNQKKHPGIQEL
jgi:hypothetical protein